MRLLQKYHKYIESQGFEYNFHQEEVLKKLAVLQDFLENQEHFSGFFRRFFFQKQGKKLHKQSIYIYGSVGRGKSMVMDIFYDILLLEKKKRVHFHEFMRDIHQSIFLLRQKNNADPLQILAKDFAQRYSVICFDEMEVRDIADAMIIARLFTFLLQQGIVFVMTSNRSPEDLYKEGLQREKFIPFIELLKSDFQILSLDHPQDYRLKQGMQGPFYFSSSQGVRSFFESLEGQEMAEILSVQGRNLYFPRTKSSILYISFEDLFNVPFASNDYMVIVQCYPIICLDEIPEFSALSKGEDQMRRLILFIDVLYEKKGLLITHFASLSPEILYHHDQKQFEFQRTLSRIIELGSRSYISLHYPSYLSYTNKII